MFIIFSAVKCPEIDIDSMTAINRNTSERVYNTYVKYECDTGQRMVDGGTYRILKCDASKEWSDEVTSCGCEYDVTFYFCFTDVTKRMAHLKLLLIGDYNVGVAEVFDI